MFAFAVVICCCAQQRGRPQSHPPSGTAKPVSAVPQAGPRSSGPPSQVAPDAAAKKQEYFVLIDPGHGGADKGATLGSGISEKQVTLAFARELRKQLAERGIASHLLREADTPVSLEQRAEMANQQRPFLYLGIHASTGPKGVRVYAPRAQKPSSPAPAFLDWDAAQFPAMERSAGFARSVTRELQRREIHAVGLTAVLRPLNNVTAPAIGIEIAAPAVDAGTLLTQKVENPIATALATAVAQFRPGGARP